MTYDVHVQPAAEEDIAGAVAWYDTRAARLSERLIDEIASAMARIGETPKMFRPVYGPVRRAPLHVFPYFIWFLLDEDTARAQVIAVTHHRRDPAGVQSELEGRQTR